MPTAPLTELLAFQNDAYALALSKLGRSADAEDAVQEAYLRVLRLKIQLPEPAYRKCWFLKVVLNVTRDRWKGDRRREAREQRSEQAQRAESMTMEPDGKQAEVRSAVLEALASLDEKLRVALSLHYLQGLTLPEAAEVADMPEGTMSTHVSRGLKALREKLERMGYAVSPSVVTGIMLEGLGVQASPALSARLQDLCAKHAAGELPVAAASEAGRGAGRLKAAWIVAAALTLPAAWLGWMALRGNASAMPNGAPAVQAAQESTVDQKALPASEPVLLRRWDFNASGPPAGLTVIQGSWKHVPGGGPDGSGCMETESEMTIVEVAQPALVPPMVLTVRHCNLPPIPALSYSVFTVWSNNRLVGQFRNLGEMVGAHFGQWMDTRDNVGPNHIDHWVEGRRSSLEYNEPAPGARLQLCLRGKQRLDELTIRVVKEGELPDVSTPLAALHAIPAERRVGTVTLPTLASKRPPAPVVVLFESAGGPEIQEKAP